MVKKKYRSQFTNEHLHQCLRLAITPFVPKFKSWQQTKGATTPTEQCLTIYTIVLDLFEL
jgi:hypothetical protein